MTKAAIEELSNSLTGYILQLKRAPTNKEVSKFITEFIRARAKGRLMVP